MTELASGDLILLVDKVGRRHRVRLKAGERHSLHSGQVAHDDLIGRPEGVVVTTQLGARLVGADIHPGARVLEAGTGTGALTLAALRAVGPEGLVVSYEQRED